MEVIDGEEVGAARFEPIGRSQCLALRAVTVAAGVIHGAPVPASETLFEVTAEGRGAAMAESTDHLVLNATHRMRSGVAIAMPA